MKSKINFKWNSQQFFVYPSQIKKSQKAMGILSSVLVCLLLVGINVHAEIKELKASLSSDAIEKEVQKAPKQVSLTYNPQIQKYLRSRIADSKASHIAAVVLNPKNGAILGSFGKSKSLINPVMHAGYPAASLFKIITASAALDSGSIKSNSKINYRGGTYTLNRYNYKADQRRDRLSMSVSEAMGKSCNPVFSRLALGISPSLARVRRTLEDYAYMFNFNTPLSEDLKIPISRAYIPDTAYGLGRTGAGFGKVSISPVHAASIIGAIANNGIMAQPHMYETIENSPFKSKKVLKSNNRRVISKENSLKLQKLLKETVVSGTARREFNQRGISRFPFDIIAKTGTLTGSNPKGLTKWFIAGAPVSNPKYAIAVVSVGARTGRDRPAVIGRDILEFVF